MIPLPHWHYNNSYAILLQCCCLALPLSTYLSPTYTHTHTHIHTHTRTRTLCHSLKKNENTRDVVIFLPCLVLVDYPPALLFSFSLSRSFSCCVSLCHCFSHTLSLLLSFRALLEGAKNRGRKKIEQQKECV